MWKLKRNSAFQWLMILISGVIIIDFLFPGEMVNDTVVKVERIRQSHHNASGNSHFSFTLVGEHHKFDITEDFANTIDANDEIRYSISPLFKEVNRFKKVKSNHASYFPLRVISGFVSPMLILLLFAAERIWNWGLKNLQMVLAILLVVDLVYLILH